MEGDQRFRKVQIAAAAGIAGNLLLAAIKGIIGFISGSKALLADAAMSVSDVAGSIVVLLGIRLAKKPPDEDHPYGHGKAESIAAVIVAVLLTLVGFEIGKTSIEAFFKPVKAPQAIAIAAAVTAIIIKELMFQYNYRLGKRLKSDALIANAHDHRSDVFASLAALLGISAALIGSKFEIGWLLYADPFAGAAVSVLVLYTAWKVGREALHASLDHVLHEEETEEMKKTIRTIDGVKRIDQLHAREHGHYVIVDVKISVDASLTVKEGHDIARHVRNALIETEEVQNVFVHVNPFNSQ
ncbi:cation diffusion facilitator family transporter [Bacillus mangrovi]|uniref:Cation diffusion facilitator family transporter n=1 Tax=Metabacillus mangrovi TaxID=1491830 RepID=A0A7X2S2L2_9BACI|nr:cation diffusion facilitator family transporter [Metabacillus mangrovi]MTH52548.1 cation diffusion facilitator family transporter [Metabacillus mangrovi]